MYTHEYFSAKRDCMVLGVSLGVRYRIDISHIGKSDGLGPVAQRFDCDGATRIIRLSLVFNGDAVVARIVFRGGAIGQHS